MHGELKGMACTWLSGHLESRLGLRAAYYACSGKQDVIGLRGSLGGHPEGQSLLPDPEANAFLSWELSRKTQYYPEMR